MNKESKILLAWVIGTIWSFIFASNFGLNIQQGIAGEMIFQCFICGIALIYHKEQELRSAVLTGRNGE